MTIQKRENDLVVGTFGRGFYVLDDYSALRDLTPQALNEDARLFPLRDAYIYNQVGMAPAGTAGIGAMAGNWTAPNPPYGAVFTYSVNASLPSEEKLVLTISDETGRQIRRLDLDKSSGLRRIAWNLRGEIAADAGGRAAGRLRRRPRRQPGSRRRAGPVSGHARATRRRHGHTSGTATEFLGAAD